MDCKNALLASGGDLAAAEAWILDTARSRLAAKSERFTPEGTLALSLMPRSALLFEINSETDFVGRLEDFQLLALDVAAVAHTRSLVAGPEAFRPPAPADEDGPFFLNPVWTARLQMAAASKPQETVSDAVVKLFMKVGEKMSVRRAVMMRASYPHGAIGSFIQGDGLSRTGTVAALVTLRAHMSLGQPSATGDLQPLADLLAQHVAGTNPKHICLSELPKNEYGKSQDVLEEQMLNIGKEKGLVRDLLLYAGARLKCRVTIDHFVRWRVGEGLPKSTADFATEVAKELKKERNQQQKGP